MVSYPTRKQQNMDSIVSNITGGFLNDILKATAPDREYANYQNIILPELVSAVKKYNDFKDSVLESLRSRKSQPTIKEAFAKCERDTKYERDAKCERDVLVKKLNEQDAVLKDFVRLNKQTSDKIDYFMRIKMVDDVAKVVECVSPLESAHQKAREYTPKVVEDTPKVVEDTPNIQITITENDVNVADETTEEEETTDEATEEVEVVEQAPDGEEETTGEVEVAEQAPDGDEETTEEVEVDEETTEDVVEQAPDGEEETTDEVEEVEVEEDVSEEEIEVDADEEEEEEIEVDADEEEEEVEEFTHKGKKYYVTNTTNGKIYSCTADDDIGDQVGSFKNGKPIFS